MIGLSPQNAKTRAATYAGVFYYLTVLAALYLSPLSAKASEVAITMDDHEVAEYPIYKPLERNRKILEALQTNNVKAALFVCGMRVDNDPGKKLLSSWNRSGHVLANHSYSHLYFHGSDVGLTKYIDDFRRGEAVIKSYSKFQPEFRFPFLKEGNTVEKRDGMRQFLSRSGYRNGYVTIDASDWYVNQRLVKRITTSPASDLTPYRDFYLKHIWARALFYDDLAKKVLGRSVKHTLLIHHNLLNALYLKDLLALFKERGWNLVDASEALKDPVFNSHPQILPAGESIIWGLAKETGKYEDVLRYPGEDSVYKKEEMDRLGL